MANYNSTEKKENSESLKKPTVFDYQNQSDLPALDIQYEPDH